MTGGWLPGALVERVSRSAVRLLNLEAGESATGASGPVGFSRPSVTAGGDAGVATPASGVFGPPPVMPAPTSPSYPPSPPAPAPAPSPALLSVPGPRHPGPPDDDPGAGTGTTRPPGRLALSVAATSTQGAQGRGRRISCTVALAVAGALAAVTVGSVFVLDLLPGSGNDANNAGGNEASHDPPAATPGGLPARYLGTWEGQAAALDGKLPLGTFRITIKQAKAGQELGRLRQTDALGGVCVDVITLKKVTEKQLVAGSAGAEGNHDGCNPAPTTVTFTPVGDDLDYASKSEESGRPTARLSKVG